MAKKIVYVDMDGVLVNLEAEVLKVLPAIRAYPLDQQAKAFEEAIKWNHKTAFREAKPIPGADLAFPWLCKHFDVYLLSTPMWDFTRSWEDKRLWVEEYLGKAAEKRLILTHNKGLVKGDYLIDDRIKHGVDSFEGEHIHFGTKGFETWFEVMSYLKKKEGI